jgi:hypothetical protein
VDRRALSSVVFPFVAAAPLAAGGRQVTKTYRIGMLETRSNAGGVPIYSIVRTVSLLHADLVCNAGQAAPSVTALRIVEHSRGP